LVGLFRGQEAAHVKKQRGNGDLALSGRNLKGRHNNQPKDGVPGKRDIGEVAQGGWSLWGGIASLFGRQFGQ
jgi:hypothetical protein